jgi:hypothetical protein
MQSAVRLRERNSVLSAEVETPAEFPFLEVEPSLPTTRVTVTAIRARILNFSPFYQPNSRSKLKINTVAR